jgi:hypothetical protein
VRAFGTYRWYEFVLDRKAPSGRYGVADLETINVGKHIHSVLVLLRNRAADADFGLVVLGVQAVEGHQPVKCAGVRREKINSERFVSGDFLIFRK